MAWIVDRVSATRTAFGSKPSPRKLLAGALLIGALAAFPAQAQNPPPKLDTPNKLKKLPEAPDKLPRVKSGDKTKNLDFLLGALKVAPNAESAKAVEARIWAIWAVTPSDTASLLMLRAKTAMDGKQFDVARKLLDAVIRISPDYTEAWNRRATLYYLQNDYTNSMEDIRQVLIREPRHFGALAGLGLILQETGDDKHALEAFRKALAINPYLDKVPEMIKTLTEKVEGRDI